MSAHSNGLKFSIGGLFKSLFGGSTANEADTANGDSAVTGEYAPAAPAPAPAQHYSAPVNGNGNGNGHAPIFNRRPANGSNGNNGSPGGDHEHGTARMIQISLQSIICVMPPDLRARVRQAVPDSMMVTISLEKILPQLSQGAVKVPFGDIRRAIPHIFAAAPDADTQLVSLPLGEILPHLKPSMLPRRQAQKQTEVSADVVGPFGAGVQGVSITSDKPAAPAPKPLPKPAPRETETRPVGQAQGFTTQFKRTQSPQPTLPPRQSIQSVTPAQLPPTAPIPMTPAVPVSRQPIAPAPAPIVPAKPAAPVAPTPISPIAPTSQPIRVVPNADTTPPVILPLVSLIGAWPEVVRNEVAQLNLAETQLAVPASLVEAGLKRGRVAFPWKQLRSWIRPAPLSAVSPNDSMELSLPLSVIAPIFLGRRKNGATEKQKVAVDETIPNLFFGFPQPPAPVPAPAPVAPAPEPEPEPVALVAEEPVAAPAAEPAAKPADTNYFAWETQGKARAEETNYISKPAANTDFKSRQATPQEIVAQAASLDGVAGTLIALPDGLRVASQVPADLNADTLAAFLPQLFNKMSQCTRELRMGELNNLNFTVGNVPWKIFRVNAVFFAAFGYVGHPLPTAQLVALAGLLDRKNK